MIDPLASGLRSLICC